MTSQIVNKRLECLEEKLLLDESDCELVRLHLCLKDYVDEWIEMPVSQWSAMQAVLERIYGKPG